MDSELQFTEQAGLGRGETHSQANIAPSMIYPTARWNVAYSIRLWKHGRWILEQRFYLAMDTWEHKHAERLAAQFNHIYCSGECLNGLYRCGEFGITKASVVEVRYE